MKRQTTYSPRAADIERSWWLFDAEGVTLGRLATQVATLLRGKHKPTYSPHMDGGDYVVVVNADKVTVSGSKETAKMYYQHSGHPGGLREESLQRMRSRRPARIVERAVKGMLPKNRLGRQMYRKLKVYAGPDHPHSTQSPRPYGSEGGR